jgi:hypothetical protein
MSVVSARLDNVTLKGNRRRNFIAVQRVAPGADPAYTLGPAMVDPSATARRLGKKCDYAPPAPKGVPLYSLQRGTDKVYASTPFYETQKLKAPVQVAGGFDYDTLVTELDIPFDTPIDYAMGIRPGKRLLKEQSPPLEPAGPVFRSGKVGKAAVKYGSNDASMMEMAVLGK